MRRLGTRSSKNRCSPLEDLRRIAHIDMDVFFGSCELSQYPELRGVPTVVGGRRSDAPKVKPDGTREFARLRDYVGRGVLTTASYEARKFGVRSSTPTMTAARLAPDAIILPVNFELYRKYSRLFKEAVASVSPVIEDIGIDEVYCDVSMLEDDSETIARRLKKTVVEATAGLTCSVGLADGAQQDVQRILTPTFGFDLVVRLQAWPDADARFAAEFAGIGDRCLAIDDLVWDSVDWQHHNAPDPTKLQVWHDGCEDVVDSVWSSLSDRNWTGRARTSSGRRSAA